jgi:hypothetical protein
MELGFDMFQNGGINFPLGKFSAANIKASCNNPEIASWKQFKSK